MIKALLDNRAVFIGLSAENVRRLQEGLPILFDLAELGLEPQRVAIAAGDTEDTITAALLDPGGTLLQSVATADQPTAVEYAAVEWAITKSWQGEIGQGMAERLAKVALDTAWAARATALSGGRSVMCPRCRKSSTDPRDVAAGYCGACHDWTSRPPAHVTA